MPNVVRFPRARTDYNADRRDRVCRRMPKVKGLIANLRGAEDHPRARKRGLTLQHFQSFQLFSSRTFALFKTFYRTAHRDVMNPQNERRFQPWCRHRKNTPEPSPRRGLGNARHRPEAPMRATFAALSRLPASDHFVDRAGAGPRTHRRPAAPDGEPDSKGSGYPFPP